MHRFTPQFATIFRFVTQSRFLIKAALFGLFVVLLMYNGIATAIDPEESIRNTATVNGIVSLDMQVVPAAVQAGETVTLEIVAVNRGSQASLINVRSALPANLEYDPARVPASTSFNYQSREFVWQPLVPAGQTRSFELEMTVSVADLTQPIEQIRAQVQNGGILQQLSAEFWIGVPPQATIIAPNTIPIGEPLPLYAEIQGPGPFAQQWKMSDGRVIRAENPDISFATAGEHTIELTLENPIGKTTVRKTILVTPEPVAQFTLDDLTPGVDQVMQFVNQSGGAAPITYEWDFGDGSTASVREPAHRYSDPGSYRVTLVAENEFGRSESTVLVTVGEPPDANMVLPNNTKVGEPIFGKAFGDATVTHFEWLMGDGRRIAGDDLAYKYTQSGSYTVALIAYNAFGATQLEQQVEVEAGILTYYLPLITKLFQLAPVIVQQPQALASAPVITDEFANFTPIDLERDVAPLDSSQEERLFWYVNKARESNGLPPLRYNESLSIASKRHTNDMAFNRFTAHTGSDGSRPYERQVSAGYNGGYAGEATAWGFEFPSGAVMFWLQSPSHRPLLLNRAADEAGISFTYDESAPSIYYWTVEFGNSSGEYSLPFGPAIIPTPTPFIPLPQPTAIPQQQPQPQQPVVAEPIIVVVPQDTPVPTVVKVQPTAVPPTPLPPVVITVTATSVITKPTPLPLPTYTPTGAPSPTVAPTATPTMTPQPTATATPTSVPTSVPTATEESAVIVTVTPLPTTPSENPTPVPTPTMTLVPEVEPTTPPIIVAPTNTPKSSAPDTSAEEAAILRVAGSFVSFLLTDGSGVTALPYATYAMQAQLLTSDSLGVLQLTTVPTTFEMQFVSISADLSS
ncbi:MAG: PKD domain-containing protein, partial [Candidatus Promineifilaceae bacterium]